MRNRMILGLMLLVAPLAMMAQEDDAYFVPSKAKKKAEKEQIQRERQERIDAWNAQMQRQMEQEQEAPCLLL